MKKLFRSKKVMLVLCLCLGLAMLGTGVAFALGLISNTYTSPVTVAKDAALVLSSDYSVTSIDTGVPYQFGVRLQNPSIAKTYTSVGVNLVAWDTDNDIAAGDVTLYYWDGSAWRLWTLTDSGGTLTGTFGPAGGFTVIPSYDVTTPFQVTYNTAGTYQFQLQATGN